VIDVALYEAVFNCMESLLPEYSAFGAVRGPAGSALPGIAPTNAYACTDGGYALVAGNGDSIFRRLMTLIGRDDLANDPALADNAGRVARVRARRRHRRLDRPPHGRGGAAALDGAGVPAGRIYTVADIAPTRTTRARHAAAGADGRRQPAHRARHRAQAVGARPAATGATRPRSGQDTDAVLREIGLSERTDRNAAQARDHEQ
jgi:formyl-CoA transferase